ncbi:hypothetical protein AMECASPLE_034387 [Ameca splendens]|uniref:Uncharacterized protein n=1 Tax=Ameca splendens TaxID=208324 RepID=A0ABV0Z535_9TELE
MPRTFPLHRIHFTYGKNNNNTFNLTNKALRFHSMWSSLKTISFASFNCFHRNRSKMILSTKQLWKCVHHLGPTPWSHCISALTNHVGVPQVGHILKLFLKNIHRTIH